MKKSDPAHIATDEEIAKIEKLITKEYKKAHKEVSKKCEDYFAKFAAKDAKWQEWVAQGTKTQKEYKEWRQGQMLVGKKWEDLRDTLAQDYTNASKITMSITKGFAPEVYAINHNYATFEVEKKSLIDTSYTLYSKETVEHMYKGKPKLYHSYGKAVAKEIKEGKQYAWDRRRITSVLTQAVLQGESIPRITKRLEQVTAGDHKAAIRNARTMMTGVQNAGRIDALERAQDMGIPVKKQWLATVDGRTRHWHRELDGVAVDYDEPFKNEIGEIMFPGDPSADAANVYNCFVGDTKIATDSNIVRSYKHDYSGQLFTIKSASGIEFTCTPNHPILTASGWVAAERLKYGDNLLIASACENSFLRVNPDIDHAFARIDAIHDFFNMSGGKRATSVMVNFHGDIPTSDVEIITQKRFLRSDGNASGSNGVDKLLLKHADKTLMGKGAFVKHFGRIGFAALSFVSGMSKTLSFFFGSVRHTVVHSFRSIAGSDAIVLESKTDNMSRDSKLICKGLNGSSSIVFADDIVDIKVSSVCHMPVYNLQTENGYYFVNSIIAESGQKCNNIGAIAHNCRCTILPVVAGFEIDVKDMDLRANKDLGDMTYDEWKASKKSYSNPIDLQEQKSANIQGAWWKKYGGGAAKEHKFTGAEGKALVDKYTTEAKEQATPSFMPASSIKEAENYAQRFTDSNRFGAVGVSYDGVSVDVANIINKTIDDFFNTYNVDAFGGIIAPKGNTKLGKLVDGATAGYSPIRHSFLLNRKALKDVKTAEKALRSEREAIEGLLKHPERYDLSKLSLRVRKVVEASTVSGRATVPMTIEEVLWHELGHSLERQISKLDSFSTIKANMQFYAPKISGYATESMSEYIAESFCSYRKGEKIIDEELAKAFKQLER